MGSSSPKFRGEEKSKHLTKTATVGSVGDWNQVAFPIVHP